MLPLRHRSYRLYIDRDVPACDQQVILSVIICYHYYQFVKLFEVTKF